MVPSQGRFVVRMISVAIGVKILLYNSPSFSSKISPLYPLKVLAKIPWFWPSFPKSFKNLTGVFKTDDLLLKNKPPLESNDNKSPPTPPLITLTISAGDIPFLVNISLTM